MTPTDGWADLCRKVEREGHAPPGGGGVWISITVGTACELLVANTSATREERALIFEEAAKWMRGEPSAIA